MVTRSGKSNVELEVMRLCYYYYYYYVFGNGPWVVRKKRIVGAEAVT